MNRYEQGRVWRKAEDHLHSSVAKSSAQMNRMLARLQGIACFLIFLDVRQQQRDSPSRNSFNRTRRILPYSLCFAPTWNSFFTLGTRIQFLKSIRASRIHSANSSTVILKLNLFHIFTNFQRSFSNLNQSLRKNILRRLEFAFLPSFCSPSSTFFFRQFLVPVKACSPLFSRFEVFFFTNYLAMSLSPQATLPVFLGRNQFCLFYSWRARTRQPSVAGLWGKGKKQGSGKGKKEGWRGSWGCICMGRGGNSPKWFGSILISFYQLITLIQVLRL